jgi:hypothetical protein
MPRLVAWKDLKWTGQVVWHWDEKKPMGEGDTYVRIDGVAPGPRLTGRQLGDDGITRVRWYFEKKGEDGLAEVGLPGWWKVLRKCLKCGHLECPGCEGTCDTSVGNDGDMCCDGQCFYSEEDRLKVDDGSVAATGVYAKSCPKCGAEPGERCRWRAGYFGMFAHAERIASWAGA